MDLVVFDLDGTLLNQHQQLSPVTIETLNRMKAAGIAYTVATGRTHLAAQPCLAGHDFPLWQIYKNGVEWWHPETQRYRHHGILSLEALTHTLEQFSAHKVTPFIFCLEPDGQQSVFHEPPTDRYAQSVFEELSSHANVTLKTLEHMPNDAQIINISALGHPDPLSDIVKGCQNQEHLIAYSGGGIYHPQTHWIDIHHSSACKGSAIAKLKEELNASNIIVFGDGDNDLTMFSIADEAYATANAPDYVQAQAKGTVGHHNEDGVAKFLMERFQL